MPGAGGTIGLAQFVNQANGDPTQLIVGGYVMVGAILTNASPVTLDQVTPIARLTGEYEAIVVPAASDIKDMAGLVAKLKADPGAVSWGGGSAGGTDHITAGLIAKAAGVDPTKVNYIAFSGGGEALAAILGGQVTVGISGYGEFAVADRGRRSCGCSASPATAQVAGIDAPTLQGRRRRRRRSRTGAWSRPPRASPTSRRPRSRADVEKMVKSAAWKKTLADQGLGRHLSRRRRLRGAAQEGHRRDQRDPERDRPREMSDQGQPDSAAPPRLGGAGHRRPALAVAAVVIAWRHGA